MTLKQYKFCIQELPKYTDADAYVSDIALSSIWEDSTSDEIPADRVEAIEKIWDAYHKSVKEIAAEAGMTQRKLADRFCIPLRTVEDWCAGKRTPPDYVRLMMQELLGLLKI